MKRNVEYIVFKTASLLKSETFKERLIKIKEENQYHYVIAPSGKLYILKDAELNSEDDNGCDMECVHLLIMLPFSSAFNTLFYLLFRAYSVFKKMKELIKRFEGVTLINDEGYHEKCCMKMELNIMETKIKIKEAEMRIKMMEDLGFKDIQNN